MLALLNCGFKLRSKVGYMKRNMITYLLGNLYFLYDTLYVRNSGVYENVDGVIESFHIFISG